ncbi:RmlC-like cupin domain-containing protein [Aspergillus multicolor]|uniref:RmlC-like cupin domain-containing protein n=1 Tax=Aspergillus multicolor TaxID=41759 RepID=UPI003CCCC80B
MRIPVSGNSSAGTFTILQVTAPESATVGVVPHIHKRFYENFYCSRGRLQLWTQKNVSDAEQNTRVLTQGDFGAVAKDTIHTFQTLDPDTMFTVVIQPGGFEGLFLYRGGPSYDSAIGSAFLPADAPPSSETPPLDVLQSFDHWPVLNFVPRRDDMNGIAGSGNWHDGPNQHPTDEETEFYIAKNWGQKYLNSEEGVYRIITPLQTETTSGGNLTMGTITMSPLDGRQALPSETVFAEHTALSVEEGQLVVTINEETAHLIQGDLIFIPAGTPFKYYASAAATKFLYVNTGRHGLQSQLLQNSIPWNYAAYPQYAP